MPNCSYIIKFTDKREEVCNFEVDNSGEDLCYIHRCITKNEKIDDENKFSRFIDKHRETFSFGIEHPRMLINFNFKYTHAKGNFFNNIIFLKNVNFDNTTFGGPFAILNCDFEENVSFTKIRVQDYEEDFHLKTEFKNIKFKKVADFSNSSLNNCFFKDIDFSKCFLGGAKFINCSFVNITWATKRSWVPLIGEWNKRKGVIFDELSLKKKDEKYFEKLSDLERIYRSLKSLAKTAEDRDMEGEFNYSENEMIRKRKGFLGQLITSKFWYFVGSRYGERPFYAFINILLIVCFFSAVFRYIIPLLEKYILFQQKWEEAITQALSPLILNKWQLFEHAGLLTIFSTMLEGSLLAIQIGLFVNALRRKLQR